MPGSEEAPCLWCSGLQTNTEGKVNDKNTHEFCKTWRRRRFVKEKAEQLGLLFGTVRSSAAKMETLQESPTVMAQEAKQWSTLGSMESILKSSKEAEWRAFLKTDSTNWPTNT